MAVRYVCGFAICGSDVVLVLRNRHDFLRGQYNGIGGKIEYKLGDVSASMAMVRKFKEESGIDTTVDEWEIVGNLFTGRDIVHFFKCEMDRERFDEIKTIEDEKIMKVCIADVLEPKFRDDAMEPQLRLEKYADLFLRASSDKNMEMMNITLI